MRILNPYAPDTALMYVYFQFFHVKHALIFLLTVPFLFINAFLIPSGSDDASMAEKTGPVRELNPGPLTPEARIIPLDQQA